MGAMLVKCLECGRDNLPSTRFGAGCGTALRIELPVRDPARVLKRMRKAFAPAAPVSGRRCGARRDSSRPPPGGSTSC